MLTASPPVCVESVHARAFRGIATMEKRVNYFTSRKSYTGGKREIKREREREAPGTSNDRPWLNERKNFLLSTEFLNP